jgi:hypothetical protein
VVLLANISRKRNIVLVHVKKCIILKQNINGIANKPKNALMLKKNIIKKRKRRNVNLLLLLLLPLLSSKKINLAIT